MDFAWTEDQVALKETAVAFARKELNEGVIERDRESTFSREGWRKCAGFGLMGLPFPEEYGGAEADILTTMLVMEGMGNGCKDSGLLFGINAQMWSVQMPIHRFGSEDQKKRYLGKLCDGSIIGGHGMTEPNSGSDAFSLATTAVLDGDHYVLNGTKTFVTNGPVADVFVVFATVDRRKKFLGVTAFILERGMPGLTVGKEIEKAGLRTVPMGELILENCRVPVGNRLGREGGGAAIFNDSMEWERCCILATCVGAMERQLETCVRHARSRRQFGKPIGQFQSVANRMVDMKVRMEMARLLLYKVAWLKKDRAEAGAEAAILKLFLSEAWVQSCLDAIQVHGGYGYTTEYEIERDLRDALGGTLYSGTSEIQRNIIARHLGL